MPTGRSPYAHGRGEGRSIDVAAISPAPKRSAPSARTASRNGAGRGASAILLTGERKESEDPRALHRFGDLRLMARACARDPPGHDLAAIRDEPREPPVILVVDPIDLV